MSPIRKFLRLLGTRNRRKFAVVGLLMVMNAVLELITVSLVPAMIMLVTFPQDLEKVPWIGKSFYDLTVWMGDNYLYYLGGCILVFVFFKTLFFVFMVASQGTLLKNFHRSIGSRIFRTYMVAPLSFHVSRNLASLMKNLNAELGLVVNQLSLKSLSLIADSLVAVSLIVVLWVADPIVFLITITAFGLVVGVFMRSTERRASKTANALVEIRNKKSSVALNALQLIKEIKILNNQDFFLNRFDKQNTAQAQALRLKNIMNSIPKGLMEMTGFILVISVILIFASQGKGVEETVALIALFVVTSARLRPLLTRMSNAYNEIRFALPSLDVVYSVIFDTPKEGKGDDYKFQFDGGKISFSNVTFKYDGTENNTLNKFNLDIEIGSKVALVGGSGAGKSTVIQLIMGLLVPTSGDIIYNETDVVQHLKAWRRHISFIPQDVVLINDTIRNNICFGLEPTPEMEVKLEELIRVCHLDELIDELPGGLDTVVGDRGNRLSGGQVQRIGIARALYYEPEVLIMDEATSALDNITETLISTEIKRIMQDRTIIVIAHRLSTIQDCDVIHVIKKGEVISSGNFDELSSKSKVFQKLQNVLD